MGSGRFCSVGMLMFKIIAPIGCLDGKHGGSPSLRAQILFEGVMVHFLGIVYAMVYVAQVLWFT